MFNYNIDWNNVIKILVPPVYRQTIHLDWLKALTAPIRSLYSSFVSYKDDKMYFSSITFQQIAIEKLLNDLYDNTHRRIYLEDVTQITNTYIANKALGYPPVYVYNSAVSHDELWVYNKNTTLTQLDFLVKVPAMLMGTINLNQMKAYIDDYAFAGKRYEIQSI